MRKAAERFRRLAINMGGVMIKVGQFLSTRVDILPREVTSELAGLQDEIPPVPFEKIRSAIESEFHHTLEDMYLHFNEAPLAAASLGQVHEATLNYKSTSLSAMPSEKTTGVVPPTTRVVVKVQRPDIENLIRTDLEALKTVGGWLNRYPPIRRRANVPALLDEFSRILFEEIDYLAEGRNAEVFAQNFADDPRICVPKVYWTHTTVRVLTLENVYSIKITDYDAISRANINRSKVASLLLDTYLKQIFEDGFFHADPHPGNLFVEPRQEDIEHSPSGFEKLHAITQEKPDPINFQLTFVDFGMVGRIPPALRAGLRELLIGVGTRDTQRVIKAYQQMDILLPDADLVMIERAGSRVFEQFWGKNMSELRNLNINDIKEFANEFRDLLYDLPFQVPQDLIFLARCVNILSGMCTGLDSQFNVFNHLAPFAQKLITEEARANRKDWINELETLARAWLSAPMKLDALLGKLEGGYLVTRDREVSQQVSRLDRTMRTLGAGIIFASLLLGGIQLYLSEANLGAAVLFTGAAITFLWILWRNATS